MITIGIVDDGIGIFPTLYKLKQVVPANFVGLIERNKNFSTTNKSTLKALAQNYLDFLRQRGCDAVVFSSIDLSAASFKHLSAVDFPLFGSEPPVNHATTYTISNVLVLGGPNVRYIRQPNVIPCPMADFPSLATQGNYKRIVDYIAQTTAEYDGKFDCIALAHSSMNMYKSCFSRVYPNVQIFDSLEGVARRVRKKYKKAQKEEGEVTLIDATGKDICQEYAVFMQ